MSGFRSFGHRLAPSGLYYPNNIRRVIIYHGCVSMYMRPEYECDSEEVYECFECGRRTDSAGECECGGELLHIGRSRDL
ncbi:rubrerythrin-like domain-containing protein [Halorubrum sp. T3]|nr:rubrerythrin-like domain-containing protein [Halorubrum sp. T3]